MIVGLTGGIGSGKSTVAKFFRELGVPVYNSDKEAKILMHENSEVKSKIISLFGEKAYVNNELNRKFIASEVFSNEEKLKALNAIVHPAVKAHFLNWADKQDYPYVIQEAAIIFENNSENRYDKIILVIAPKETRISRVMNRDGNSTSDIKARIENQLSDEEKIPRAHFVIKNIALDKTRQNARKIHEILLNAATKH
ncbi:dephospho-CoA kinase [Croceivirga lutea]|uniref:dephospho-CoA kinase n=1 Tax=Croceivirga lutea TaxID=1775167 RepID=UPI00163B574A|nr:dephospho-CoA kinase [Croceivirga lutea]GGG46865.1 dephospho-CoA kinase [Croceivirga lutea]